MLLARVATSRGLFQMDLLDEAAGSFDPNTFPDESRLSEAVVGMKLNGGPESARSFFFFFLGGDKFFILAIFLLCMKK